MRIPNSFAWKNVVQLTSWFVEKGLNGVRHWKVSQVYHTEGRKPLEFVTPITPHHLTPVTRIAPPRAFVAGYRSRNNSGISTRMCVNAQMPSKQ